MPLFLMGCFPVEFQEVERPLGMKSVKRPIKVRKRPINERKRPINERKRPINAMVLVGISVGCLMGCFRAPKPCRKTAPLKRPIKRSMNLCLGLKFSSEIDNFKSATHHTPFCLAGNSEGQNLNFQTRLKFQARLKFKARLTFFNLKFGPRLRELLRFRDASVKSQNCKITRLLAN